LIFSVTGLIVLWEFIKIRIQKPIMRIMRAALILIIVLSMADVAYFMIKYHPYQNLYFNILAGRDMRVIKERFDLDYGGLLDRKALEYILKNDNEEVIKIYASHPMWKTSVGILTEDCKKRFLFVTTLDDAKYFLSNYHGYFPKEYRYKEEFFSIKIGDEKIMVVYKLK